MAKIDKIKVGSTTYDIGGASGGYATCTLTTSGWTGTAPSLTQTVSSGTDDFASLTSSDHPVCDVIISSSSSIDASNEAWSKIWKADTGNGSITFYASEAPSIALSVAVKW